MKTSTPGLRTLLHGALGHVWADFYTITLADTTVLRWVTNYPGASVSWTSVALGGGAQTYSVAGVGATPGIHRSSVKEKVGLDVDELKVDLICGDATRITSASGTGRAEAAALAGTLDGATVVLERVYYSDAVQTAAGSVYRYNGLVTSSATEAGLVTLTIASPLSQLSRTLPRNFYTPLCGHSLYDTGCTVVRATWTWTEASTVYYSADGITATEIRITRASTAPTWSAGPPFLASIGLPNGMRWNATYTSFSGGGPFTYKFTLDQPQPVGLFPAGTFTAVVEARCDKTIGQCRDRFGNLTRRRGFDFIPAPDAVTRNTGLKTYNRPDAPGGLGEQRGYHSSEERFTAQTSAYGRPIPIVYGTQRIGGNIILAGVYFTDATNYAGTPVNSGLVQLGLCEGPIDSVPKCWIEKTVNTPAGKGWTILTGTRPQSPWTTLNATNSDIALGYSGVALVCSPNGWTQAATGELENATYVVRGVGTTGSSYEDPTYTGAFDVDPWALGGDVLGDANWGLGLTMGLSAPAVAGSWYYQCQAMMAFVSMAIVETREAREILTEVIAASNGAVVWSEGLLKAVPLATERLTSSFGTYVPAVTPIYDLGGRSQGADFLADQGQAPIQVERVANVDRFNCFPIEYTSRSSARVTAAGATLTEPNNEYTKMTYDGDAHPTDSQARGVVKAPVLSLPCITRLPHVKLLSRLLANQSVAKTATYRFRLGWRFALLECGDLVTLTEANLGLSRQLVRVTEVTEIENGDFELVAEGVGYSGTIPAATYTVS